MSTRITVTKTSSSKLLPMKPARMLLAPVSPALAWGWMLAQKTPALRCHSLVQEKGQSLSRQGGECLMHWAWRIAQCLGQRPAVLTGQTWTPAGVLAGMWTLHLLPNPQPRRPRRCPQPLSGVAQGLLRTLQSGNHYLMDEILFPASFHIATGTHSQGGK